MKKKISLITKFALVAIFASSFQESNGETRKAPASELSKLNAAIAARPTASVLYHNRAAYNMMRGNFALALPDMNKAVALSHSAPDMLLARAQLYLSMKNYARAVGDLTRAIKDRPSDAKARFLRSTANEALNKYDDALADLNIVLRSNPRIGYLYAERGSVYMKKRQPAKALADYNAALFCSYQDLAMLKSMYTEYLKEDKFDSALPPLNRLIATLREKPEKAALYRQRLQIYEKQEHPDQNLIAGDLLKIADLEPQNVEVRWRFAESQWQRQPGLALPALDEAIKVEPNNAKMLSLRARIEVEHDHPELAIQDCDNSLRLDPRSAIDFCTRAEARLALKKYQEAINDAASAASLSPDLADAYYYKGAAHQALRQNQDALAAFNQYLTIKSRDAVHNDDDAHRIEEAKRRIKFVEGSIATTQRMEEVSAKEEARRRAESDAANDAGNRSGNTGGNGPAVNPVNGFGNNTGNGVGNNSTIGAPGGIPNGAGGPYGAPNAPLVPNNVQPRPVGF